MPSRRDEARAAALARRRLVAAFVSGDASAAPGPRTRPVAALVFGCLLAAVLLGAGAVCGQLRPGAPRGWADRPGRLLVGQPSGARYLLLPAGQRRRVLHPVLNVASARLLAGGSGHEVLHVPDAALDAYRPRGAAVGIPGAPDRLPSAAALRAPSTWLACEPPSGGPPVPALVPRDGAGSVPRRGLLDGATSAYVRGADGTRYLVDASGRRYRLGASPGEADRAAVAAALFGPAARARPVDARWLALLRPAATIDFPDLPGRGGPAPGWLGLPARHARVGLVLRAAAAGGHRSYLVERDGLAPISDLTARLVLAAPAESDSGVYGAAAPRPLPVSEAEIDRAVRAGGRPRNPGAGWPTALPVLARSADPGGVLCVLDDQGRRGAAPRLWRGRSVPGPAGGGPHGARIRPGAGALYREADGPHGSRDGPCYLVTDTGYRYRLAAAGYDGAPPAARLLGYGGIVPTRVPAAWSRLLPRGPTLGPKRGLPRGTRPSPP